MEVKEEQEQVELAAKKERDDIRKRYVRTWQRQKEKQMRI
jgi:hypothetical protein